MALFQRFVREDNLITVSTAPAAVAHSERFVVLIVGLGNIGKQYNDTRHNLGFATLDHYRAHHELPAFSHKTKLHASVSEGFVAGIKVILAKPDTLYNLSGQAVQLLLDYYKLSPADLIVVHDELDLPFGIVRKKQGGGTAGNNGIKSISGVIGNEFERIRIGIRSDALEHINPTDFVLAKLTPTERAALPEVLRTAVELLPR